MSGSGGDSEASGVLLVAGSLRRGGYTTKLLRRTAQLVQHPVIDSDDVRTLPMYDADLDGDGVTAQVEAARQRVARARGLLIATPQYNGTVPGGLKNWLDWMSRPFRAHVLIGKPTGVVGAAPGQGGALPAVTWLRNTLESLGAVVVGETVAIPNVAEQLGGDGAWNDEVETRLRGLASALDDAIGAVSHDAVG